jgi:predicted benzoate:H+ symporter BenE
MELLVRIRDYRTVTITLFSPCVTISAFIESVSLVLLRLILSPKVVPPSFEALKIISCALPCKVIPEKILTVS